MAALASALKENSQRVYPGVEALGGLRCFVRVLKAEPRGKRCRRFEKMTKKENVEGSELKAFIFGCMSDDEMVWGVAA
jgi:hypothetical protein